MSEPQLSIRSAKAKELAHALARRTCMPMNRFVEQALEHYDGALRQHSNRHAIDTSVIVAITLDEPEAETFKTVLRQEYLLIGWSTLLETRIVLSAKGFSNVGDIVSRLAMAPNVTATVFDGKHEAVHDADVHYGRGRHPAALNMSDCFSYAVASVDKAPLLFNGNNFARADIKCHPLSKTP